MLPSADVALGLSHLNNIKPLCFPVTYVSTIILNYFALAVAMQYLYCDWLKLLPTGGSKIFHIENFVPWACLLPRKQESIVNIY